MHPAMQAGPKWMTARVGDDTLRVDPQSARKLAFALDLIGPEPAGSSRVFVAPLWTGVYPALRLRSPTWETYALFPRGADFEATEIERLRAADVRLAILQDIPAGGRDELRFTLTHPRIVEYLDSTLVRRDVPKAPKGTIVLEAPAR
jgi:hypothetical protein